MRLRGLRTWPGRLGLTGAVLFVAGIAMYFLGPPARAPGEIMFKVGGFFVYSGVVTYIISQITRGLRRNLNSPIGVSLWTIGAMSTTGLGISQILVFLVTQGNAATSPTRTVNVNSSGLLPTLEAFVLAECLLYLLLTRPEIIRRKLPFEHASELALRLVPAELAFGAAIITSSYLLALHFFNEPLARLSWGVLTASIVAVMAILTPFYQLVARACWRYGLADLLDPSAWRGASHLVSYEISKFREEEGLRYMREIVARTGSESTERPDRATKNQRQMQRRRS